MVFMVGYILTIMANWVVKTGYIPTTVKICNMWAFMGRIPRSCSTVQTCLVQLLKVKCISLI